MRQLKHPLENEIPESMKIAAGQAKSCSPGVLGQHLLVALYDCESDALHDNTALVELVGDAARATGATVLRVVSHEFEPQGMTAVALLSESHASLHTYPEHGLVFWDCFTCGLHCEPRESLPVLLAALKPKRIHEQIVTREGASPVV